MVLRLPPLRIVIASLGLLLCMLPLAAGFFAGVTVPRGRQSSGLTLKAMAEARYHSNIVALSPGKPNLGKGGAVLQKPGLQTAARVAPPKNKEKTENQQETKEEYSERFAVLLVGDKSYDQGHVVKVLCKVIPGLGAMKAVAAFQDAQTKGRAIVLITDEENAETIAELISRNKPVIVTDVEPLAPGQ